MKIQFKIDPERLTFDDMVALDDFKAASMRERRETLINNMVDEKGDFVDPKVARAVIGKLKLSELTAAFLALSKAVEENNNAQLPPPNGSA
jgi:hypothetical protein